MSSNIASTNTEDEVIPAPVPPPPLPANNRPKPLDAFPSASRITDHTWAIDHPEIRKACYLARVCPVFPPKACRLKDIPSILQEGPTCGLAALSMLGLGEPSPAQLLRDAKEQLFTSNGEMFSAANLLELARQRRTGLTVDDVDDEPVMMMRLYDGTLSCDEIRRTLSEGGCLLVPYPFSHN